MSASVSSTSRRTFLLSRGRMAAAIAVAPGVLAGCAGRFIERSAAYAAWQYPDPSLPPSLRVVHAALLAANPHNTQPWRFQVDESRVVVLRDPTRSLGPMDGHHRELHIGLGCAIENAVLAVHAMGHTPQVQLRESLDTSVDETGNAVDAFDENADAVAVLSWGSDARAGESHPAPELHDAVSTRHTHRAAFADLPLPPDVAEGLAELARAFEAVGVGLTLLQAPDRIRRFARHSIAATEAIVADTPMNEASDAWFRYTRREIERHKDGVTLEVQGMSSAAMAGARAIGQPEPEKAGEYWIRNTERQLSSLSAVALLSSTDRLSLHQQLSVGRLYQRVALQLELWGLASHPINQLAERQDREEISGLPPVSTEALAGLLDPEAPRGTQMLFRIGFPVDPVHPAPRRPVAEVRA